MEILQHIWGSTPEGEGIILYTMRNERGSEVQLCNVGASIVSVKFADRDGNIEDVALGYQDPMSYFGDGAASGKTVGRVAGRIARGYMVIDGVEYRLEVNNGPNHLHGGPDGFQNRVWESREHEGGVEFLYYSEDGEMGYPGAVKTVARYEWTDENELRLTLTAEADAPTIINLTNHAYFNLNGEGSGSVLGHTLRLNASEYLPTSDSLIPLGESEPVAGTPMDFVNDKVIGAEIKADFPALVYGKGYDNCWVIDGYQPGQIQEAAELYSSESGRVLSVYTTQPGVQVYTGNWLSGCPVAKCGRSYNDYDGVAIECQNFPDAPNKADYPSAVLRPGEVYEQAIIFAFGVK